MLAFCVMVYYAALYIRPGEIVPSLADVPVINYLSIAFALVAAVTMVLKPRKFWDQPHDKWFLSFFVLILVSDPITGYVAGMQTAIEKFAPVAFCYVLARMGLTTVSSINRACRLVVLFTLFLAVNGLMQIYTGIGFGGVKAIDTVEGARIQGTGIFADPNDLGLAMVAVVPFVLSDVVSPGVRFFTRVVSIAQLGAFLLACYYTNSRGTIVGLGLVLAIFAYRRYGRVAATCFATFGLVLLLAFGPSRMSQVSSEEEAAQGRVQAWHAAFDMFRESPIWGIGWLRFDEYHERAAHNSFMHTLGELGFVGATMFVGMFYSYFVRLRPAAQENEASSSIGDRDSRPLMPLTAIGGLSPLVPMPAGGPRSWVWRPGEGFMRGWVWRQGEGFVRESQELSVFPRFRAAPTTPGNMRVSSASQARNLMERQLAARLARDLSDCGIGMLACMCFLSRQYTVNIYIPLALAACLSAATSSLRTGPRMDVFERCAPLIIPALTFVLICGFYVFVRLFVRY